MGSKRFAAFALTAGLLLAGSGAAVAADDESATLRSVNPTQMNSIPEVVHANAYNDAGTRLTSFNENWKFKLGDVSGAEGSVFDDSTWTNINVPHDYSIDQEFTLSGEAESAYKLGGVGWYRKTFQLGSPLENKRIFLNFDGVYMDATVYVNGTEVASHPYGYSPFQVDITEQAKIGGENTVAVRVNNQIPSSRWYSGSGIGRDVDLITTDPVHFEGNGVTVSAPGLSGSTDSVATHVSARVRNDSTQAQNISLVTTVFPKGGAENTAIGTATSEAQSVAAGAVATIESDFTVTNPTLWSTTNPTLYTVRTEIQVDGTTVDTVNTDFGYRYFNFDANTGFSLNGQNLKLKGVSMHHDQGALGSVSTRAALERQVRILKDMGVNSIRTTHNPAARELIDICNEQGILLIEEFFDGWTSQKNSNRFDYSRFFNQQMTSGSLIGADSAKTWAQFDLEQTIARDVNAPSIIMWSLGNEVTEGTRGVPGYQGIQHNLIQWTKAKDSTRPVTVGDNKFKGGSTEMYPADIAAAGGINGFNYMDGSKYDRTHNTNPTWKIYGSETASAVNSRGIYNVLGSRQDAGGQQLTSYDYSAVPWGHVASQAWYDVLTRDFVAGEYVWTGFDYLGEPTPWNGITAGKPGNASWPAPKNSYFGIIDTAGLPKDSFYFYQSQWNDSLHTLHILPTWNENVVKKDTQNRVPVVVYTDADAVELFFTPEGSTTPQSLGKKSFTTRTTPAGFTYRINEGADKSSATHQNLYFTWQVPFNAGTLTAKAYTADGTAIDTSSWSGRQSVTTTGAATTLKASVDRSAITADGTDLAYVHVQVTDKDGNTVPDAKNTVSFTVTGAGTLLGVDNGSSPDHQSYRDNNRKAHAGELIAIVQSTKNAGQFTVTASSDSLADASVSVTTTPSGQESAQTIDSFKYSRHIYLKTGSQLTLPETVEVRYTDASTENVAPEWKSLTDNQLSTPGTYTVSGTVKGVEIKVFVNVIDGVAALLNYSTTTPIGTVPALPDTRAAVLPDGTISKALFPVTWNMPENSAFGSEGTVKVTGTANVFGEDIEVSASVRVQTENIQIGKNLAPDALELTQSLDSSEQSDTLEAIRNTQKAHSSNTAGGPNPSAWSNWRASQNGKTTADLTFVYATQQRFGKATIYFFQDTSSARWPEANTTRLEVSEDGNVWTPVAATETIGNEGPQRVKPYTYTFTPVNATYVRVKVTNSTVPTGTQWRTCTGITEIELNAAEGSFSTFNTAKLASLSVNGKAVSEETLNSGEYSTRALSAEVEASPYENAAVTVLPPYDNKVKILLESEDNTTMKVFTINLAADASETELPADDASRDYPIAKITPTAFSEHTGAGDRVEGPVRHAFDGNLRTRYHSEWGAGEPPFSEQRLTMELAEPATIDALRYLPRQDGNVNGTVTSYRIVYSDNGTDWHTASEGQWPSNGAGWRMATFEPVTAKFFRLLPLHTAGEGTQANRFFSASELRLRMAPETIDISTNATVTSPAIVEVARVDTEHPVAYPELAAAGFKVTAHASEGTDAHDLTYGVDYLLSFTGNESAGEASVTIEGIEDYSGSVTKTFTITVKTPEVTGIAISKDPTKSVYTTGEKLDPTGLTITVSYSDGHQELVAYTDAPDRFAFTPALDAALAEGASEVSVTYADHVAKFAITVTPKSVDPTDPSHTTDPSTPGESSVVTPLAPSFINPSASDPASCTVKPYARVQDMLGVKYTVTLEGTELAPDSDGRYVYPYAKTIVVTATPLEGYTFAADAQTEWSWTAIPADNCAHTGSTLSKPAALAKTGVALGGIALLAFGCVGLYLRRFAIGSEK